MNLIDLLCNSLAEWQTEQNLPAECAAEQRFGDEANQFQKDWLDGFISQWDKATESDEDIDIGLGDARIQSFPEFYATATYVENIGDAIDDEAYQEPGVLFAGIDGELCLFVVSPSEAFDQYFTVLGNQQPSGTLEEVARELFDWAVDEGYTSDDNYFRR